MSYEANLKKLSGFISNHGLLNVAILTDLDGTQLDFQDRPEDVTAPATLVEDIAYLSRNARSFNVITGRDLAFVDQCLTPLQVNLSAEHHTIRRISGAPTEALATAINWTSLEDHFNQMSQIAEGVWVEANKLTSRTIHYRLVDPALQARAEADILSSAQSIAQIYNKDVPEEEKIGIKKGAMAIEIGSHAQDKGKALAEFMERRENAGAVPIFWGDSKADEPAGLKAKELGGLYIVVGPDEGQKKHADIHFESPENARRAISEICNINRNIIKMNSHFRSYDAR